MSSRFIDGGVTGISTLLADVIGFPLAIWILDLFRRFQDETPASSQEPVSV